MSLYRTFEDALVCQEMDPHGTNCRFDGHAIDALVWVYAAYRDSQREVWCGWHWTEQYGPSAIGYAEPVLVGVA